MPCVVSNISKRPSFATSLRLQRVTDSNVTFQGKCRDGQARHRTRGFGQGRLQNAVGFSEPPGVRLPYRVEFGRQAYGMG